MTLAARARDRHYGRRHPTLGIGKGVALREERTDLRSIPDAAGATERDARALASRLYGLQLAAEPRRLHGTGDDIFLVEAGRRLVLRISEAAETAENLAFQNAVLAGLAGAGLGFATPEILPSASGRLCEIAGDRGTPRLVRLLTYVPGVPIAALPPSPGLLEDVGRSLAALDKALCGIAARPPERRFAWSVRTAMDLLPTTEALASRETRALVLRAFGNFAERVLPAMDRLRHQVIHNDLNPTNVLVGSPDAARVAGIIDFGDLTFGPLVNDLAVAASRHADPGDPLPGIAAVVSGYRSALPLTAAEAAALPDLVRLRFAMRLTIWAGRAAAAGARLGRDIEEPEARALAALLAPGAQERLDAMT